MKGRMIVNEFVCWMSEGIGWCVKGEIAMAMCWVNVVEGATTIYI